MISRNAMMIVVAVLAVITVGSVAAYYQERKKTPGVEIRLDKNGLQIEQR